MLTKNLTFLDLFCGCGGFSLGMQRAGLKCLAGIDFNPEAVSVMKANFPQVPLVLEKDLTKFTPEDLQKQLNGESPDVIVGGPPCQGFSTARQVDGANHGTRLTEDPRRLLYQFFLRYVEHFKPKVFVMENVLGIRTASGGEYFTRVQAEARLLGYRVHAQTEDCIELGLPQKRRRQLFIGTRIDIPHFFVPKLSPAPRASSYPCLHDAIGDLPVLAAGEGAEEREYDLALRQKFIKATGGSYLSKVLEIEESPKLTAHRARPHSARDLRDFLRLEEGESSAEAMRRGVEFEFPYDKTSFKDRYTRQSRWQACSTIVAHLSKDGLMFIHPQQNRSLTPREAARVQSFPDWYSFPVARTHQFRVIGNAVPPLVSEAVGIAVKKYLSKTGTSPQIPPGRLKSFPSDEKQASDWLVNILEQDSRGLRDLVPVEFNRAWYSIVYIHGELHPDGALGHGRSIRQKAKDHPLQGQVDDRLLGPCYEQSGWPVALELVASEAWRRYRTKTMSDDEFYCSEVQIAAMSRRSARGEPTGSKVRRA